MRSGGAAMAIERVTDGQVDAAFLNPDIAAARKPAA
jgi:DNA-binding transcriptional regulator YdaS (Cro superfamily)